MSTKLNPKASKRDRPKSSDKLKKGKRDGTPEKCGTPSQEGLADGMASPVKSVIWNEEIEKLQIRDDELLKMRGQTPPESERKSPVTARMTVRKIKPASELNKPKPKIITVAKSAPVDARVKPIDTSGFAGPRYDQMGNVITHSILGNYDDFHREAISRGDLLDIPAVYRENTQPGVPTLKYEKKKKRARREPDQGGRNCESNALQNWQQRMLERKKQQGHISKLLQKKPEDLAMNQADNYRAIQEDRYIVDRTIPVVDYGKGYRVGSEFWKQQEKFGDDILGVHMTLTQTEKGYPPPIEHVGIPGNIRQEKGSTWATKRTRPMHYPWHKSPFLEDRKKQLSQYEVELDPHKPDFDGLEIVGVANPYAGAQAGPERGDTTEMYPDMVDKQPFGIPELHMEEEEEETHNNVRPSTQSKLTPIFGPSLQFAGQTARWTGDSKSFKDQVGIEARVNFETVAGDRVTSYLTIVNNGTTSVYYDWKKRPRDNPFDLVQSKVQRFYFNNSGGVILPGETMKFPFVFKSPNAGVFQEQWQFESRPQVCGGAALVVTLRGIAFQEDKFKTQREQLERELKQKEADHMIRHILEGIVGGMRTPERPSTPVDTYITDEEIFNRCNPKLHYHHDCVQELKQLYIDLAPPEEQEGRCWDLSVDDLKDDILLLDDDNERKESFLHQLNITVSKMSFIPQKPVHKQLYKAGYQLLVEAVEKIVTQSVLVRQVMALPEKDFDEFIDDSKSKDDYRVVSRRLSRTSSKTSNSKFLTEDSDLNCSSQIIKMNEITTQLKGTALKITGLVYKIHQAGKVSPENMVLLNTFTDSISRDVDIITEAGLSMDTTLKEKQSTMELMKKDNAICKRKLSMAILEKDEYFTQCKQLKLDLNSSQDFFLALDSQETPSPPNNSGKDAPIEETQPKNSGKDTPIEETRPKNSGKDAPIEETQMSRTKDSGKDAPHDDSSQKDLFKD